MGNSGSKGGKPEDGGASAGGSSAEGASGAAGGGAAAVESKKTCLADFVLLKTVGKGSFGKVMLVRKNDTEKVYAMKVLNKERVIARKQYDHTLSERKILEDIDHPFLVGLHFAFQSQTKLYMVFDFFNGGELYYYISKGRFTEDRARFYAAEICLGLGHLHKHNIVYRDLKPENLLLDADGHIKICDFGLSKQGVESDEVKSICGTPEYLAPEVIQHKSYGKVVDWWSFGTLVYEMIHGLPPFYDTNRQRMYKKILDQPLQKPADMPDDAFSLISGLLQRAPAKRLGYGGAEEIQAHAWFEGLDWAALFRKEIEPPFKPEVRDAEDTSNVDSTFLREVPAVTPTMADDTLVDAEKFKGFTYVEKDGAIHDCAEVGVEELQPSELPSAAEETGAGGAVAADAGVAAPPPAPDQE